MSYVEWDESFSINIDTIDNQHKKLLDLIDQSIEAVLSKDVEKSMDVIEKMRKYSVEHFSTEEKFFKKWLRQYFPNYGLPDKIKGTKKIFQK